MSVINFYLDRYNNDPDLAYKKYHRAFKDDINEGIVRNPATLDDFKNLA